VLREFRAFEIPDHRRNASTRRPEHSTLSVREPLSMVQLMAKLNCYFQRTREPQYASRYIGHRNLDERPGRAREV